MKKKVTVIALIVALLAVLSLGTAAYFTAEDTATNVITSGSVDIKLHEMAIKEPGAEPVPFENGQGVMPGSLKDRKGGERGQRHGMGAHKHRKGDRACRGA